MAFAPGWPGTAMPYSVSMPMTRRTLMAESLASARCRYRPVTSARYRYCPVLATVSMERPASVPLLPDTSVLM
jgi:hypothetical protein